VISDKPIAEAIVEVLLGDNPQPYLPISEATVHLPNRGRVWQAVFTGPEGGQVWRSTGLTDREQALLVAKKWEREARAERAKLGRSPSRPAMCVRRSTPFTGTGPLTQREVAVLLKISERAVKAIERRAIQKLRQHPVLREVWQQFLAGELDEYQLALAPEEIEALVGLTRTAEEQVVLHKTLRFIQQGL
jgi:hypothetical protein